MLRQCLANRAATDAKTFRQHDLGESIAGIQSAAKKIFADDTRDLVSHAADDVGAYVASGSNPVSIAANVLATHILQGFSYPQTESHQAV